MKTVICFPVLLLCLFAESAVGTIHRVPSQYATIQSAINASFNGDTVLVSDGTYYENIRFSGKKIVVASTFLTTGDTSHISRTIINGSQPVSLDSGSVVSFISSEDTNSVLCGFNLTQGTGTKDFVTFPPYPLRFGGGVYVRTGARICHNIIEQNSLDDPTVEMLAGGGIFCSGSGAGTVVIEQNKIRFNTVTSPTQYLGGAGVAIFAGTGRIVRNIISDNTGSAPQDLATGGGVFCADATVFIAENIIAANRVLGDYAEGYLTRGGGISAARVEGEIINNRIVENYVIQNANAEAAMGGGIIVSASHEVALAGNYIAANHVIGGSANFGGGIAVLGHNVNIENNVIVKNGAMTGGGVVLYRADADVQNEHVKGVKPRRDCQALLTHNSLAVKQTRLHSNVTPPVLMNNTMAFNIATGGLGGAIASLGSWTPKVINSIAWGDTATQEIHVESGSIRVLYSNIQGGWPSDSGNINVDPQFVDSTYRLANGSGCLQRGRDSVHIDGVWYRAPAFCFHGTPRPSPVGTQPDIGACESDFLITVGPSVSTNRPTDFELAQNYPNPFNPSTTISYEVPAFSHVTLTVCDLLGRKVVTLVDEAQEAGHKLVQWNASGVASGVYLYRLVAGRFVSTRKMTLVR